MSDTKVTPDDLRAILASEGFDASVVPDIDQPAAVRRAARQWTQGRGNADRYRAEVVYDDGKRIEVGVLRRERVTDHEVEWVQVDVVAYDVDAAGNVARDAYAGKNSDEASAVAEQARVACTYLDHEFIRPNIVAARLAAMGALPVRRAGAVSFVPRCYEAETRRLQAVVRRIGASEFEAVRVDPADADAATRIGARASENLTDAMAAFEQRLSEWESAARAVPAHAATSILEQVGDLLTRGDLYASVLGTAKADLDARLDAARDRARAVLAGDHLDGQHVPLFDGTAAAAQGAA